MCQIKSQRALSNRGAGGGFTLIELLVALAVIGILAALLMPTLSSARNKAKAASCLNNLRQLNVSWALYTVDNNNKLVSSVSVLARAPMSSWATWAEGWMQIEEDATNLALIRSGLLFKYNQSTPIYHCPSDRSTIGTERGGSKLGQPLRVRSYSLGGQMNGDPNPQGSYGFGDKYRDNRTDGDIQHPRSSLAMTFVDEQDFSIDDGCFGVPAQGDRWDNVPCSRHNLGYNLAFADGHCERWRWIKMLPAVPFESYTPDNPDLKRLQAATAIPLEQ